MRLMINCVLCGFGRVLNLCLRDREELPKTLM